MDASFGEFGMIWLPEDGIHQRQIIRNSTLNDVLDFRNGLVARRILKQRVSIGEETITEETLVPPGLCEKWMSLAACITDCLN